MRILLDLDLLRVWLDHDVAVDEDRRDDSDGEESEAFQVHVYHRSKSHS